MLREGVCRRMRGGHTLPARLGVNLVCPWLIAREVEQCNKDVVPRRGSVQLWEMPRGSVPRRNIGRAWGYGQKKMSKTREWHGSFKTSISDPRGLFLVPIEWTAIMFLPVSFSKHGRWRRSDSARGARSRRQRPHS